MRPLGVSLGKPSAITRDVLQPPETMAQAPSNLWRDITVPIPPHGMSDEEILMQLRDPKSPVGKRAMDLAMQVMGITAYHGSPYKFDKFDMSKIGTGEGAQAYGHGLYFAEQPGVARTYQQMAPSQVEIAGKAVVPTTEAELQAVNYLQNALDSGSTNPFAHARQSFRASEGLMPGSAKFKAFNDVLDRWQQSGAKVQAGGNLYKVDIPDEAVGRMLDWDKPLSQQPESVRKALDALAEYRVLDDIFNPGRGFPKRVGGKDVTGRDILKLIGERGGKRAEDWLREVGIPGIRYLDQGSRAAEKGTSNFVLFSDEIPKIVERK